jgi:CO/xanthine dehydrogenase Mo-binding subunit
LGVDTASVAHLPGVRDVVVIGDFIGVVAEREEQAIRAAQALSVLWKALPPLPDLSDPSAAVQAADATPRLLQESGDVDAAALALDITTLTRTYSWPYQMHASIGPSCALADYREAQDGRITVWSGTQNPQTLRHDLSVLIGRDEADLDIVRMEAAGCYGRNCADDVCGDALLLSRAVGAPVRVQLSRADEHLWEPKGCAQVMQVTGSVSHDGHPFAYTFTNRYPSNDSPLLASLLTGVIPADPRVYFMGDRTAVSPYTFEHTRFTCEDLAPLVRSSWLRGVSAMPNSFAHDTFIDELAYIAHADPLAFRLQHLTDTRATDLLRAVGKKAGWIDRTTSGATRSAHDPDSRFRRGRGISYARYVHSRFPGFGAAWAAWYVDLEVDTQTGEIRVLHVIVGHDAGMMINPDGVRHQVHGNIIQTLSRALKERVRFVDGKVASREWGSYPMMTFDELPSIDVLLMARPGEPPLGAGESASVPGAAAIANALFDATGVRFYAPPFTPAVVRANLQAENAPLHASGPAPTRRGTNSTRSARADTVHVR